MTRKTRTRIRWGLIVGGCTLAILLGFWGFAIYFGERDESKSFLDLSYLTAQLFTLESGGLSGPISWQLNVARFLAPLLTFTALIAGIYNLFARELKLFGLKIFGNHLVLCGLGKKGGHLVREFLENGRRVVVVEHDSQNPNIAECQDLGALVIEANSNSTAVLRRVHVEKADQLIAITGDDQINIDTAVRAGKLVELIGRNKEPLISGGLRRILHRERRSENLDCVVHITDPEYRRRVKTQDIFRDSERCDVELISVYETGAKVMIDESSLFYESDNGEPQGIDRNVLIVGFGHLGQTLLLQIAKEWRLDNHQASLLQGKQARGKLIFSVIDLSASQKEDWFREKYGAFVDYGEIQLHFDECDILRAPQESLCGWCSVTPGNEKQTPAESCEISDSENAANLKELDVAYICLDDDLLAEKAALQLAQILPSSVPIVVRYSELKEYATAFGKKMNDTDPGQESQIRAIEFHNVSCRNGQFLGGDVETMARFFHEHYFRQVMKQGWYNPDKPAHRSWHDLGDECRKSNIAIAKSVDVKLQSIGYERLAVTDRPIEPIQLSENEIEFLAEQEHNRWCGETKKTNPKHDMLMAWADLSNDQKKFNRDLMKCLPALLAAADFDMKKMDK